MGKVESLFSEVEQNLRQCHFRIALSRAMSIAQEANRYLESSSPWKTLKTDRESTATTMWVVLSVINCLKIVLCPFLPSSSEKLNYMLGFPGNVGLNSWKWNPSLANLPPGQRMEVPEPLFSKFEDDIAENEMNRLGRKPE